MNFGTPVPLLIGIVLILGAVALFFLDRFKPGYGRDSDKVYSILWLISGVFLLGHLNMELLASFQQLIMAGMLIAITIDNVLSRVPKEDRYVAQGPGDVPPRGDYYRPSRTPDYRTSSRMNVRAELDNEPPYRPRFPEDRRMLSGREEATRRRSDYYDDRYPERYDDSQDRYTDRTAPTNNRPVERLNPSGDRIRRRRPKSIDDRYTPGAPSSAWDESSTGYAANSDTYGDGGYSSGYSSSSEPSYPNRNGKDDDSYVDYRPIDYTKKDDSQSDNPSSDYGSRY
ncbi:Ycf66 family protein [Oscillatoria sp. CS-180]|uniref:Ycf66 family protein n=1 Tax=Oscillatoria sp. CS-180 TaxID=3021720 RepID=UPI00232E0A51|nr:Ycf66 family protein [Oscillatoria sp. CS-180]MDB9524473.1 Ycf66 family protein [Oscillatoria sp. CS-180]